uniref:uncharacterized protein LOC100186279 isoform X2 n=1 Tax=Ciona intestinalis TaxID=7719 RepID=UPI00089DBF91|nr:uncharacterized protein LOC100186279 isoform X2 [Ciona intestinalis]|eukprot:XP_018668425.1 uncharacterized protein LOC100186279 isoform X2 [Ciona intestinalis]
MLQKHRTYNVATIKGNYTNECHLKCAKKVWTSYRLLKKHDLYLPSTLNHLTPQQIQKQSFQYDQNILDQSCSNNIFCLQCYFLSLINRNHLILRKLTLPRPQSQCWTRFSTHLLHVIKGPGRTRIKGKQTFLNCRVKITLSGETQTIYKMCNHMGCGFRYTLLYKGYFVQ